MEKSLDGRHPNYGSVVLKNNSEIFFLQGGGHLSFFY
jgi:hypothetical protein